MKPNSLGKANKKENVYNTVIKLKGLKIITMNIIKYQMLKKYNKVQ